MPDLTYDPGRLRAAVSASGLTQRQLADRVGIAQKNVSGYLTGRTVPQADTLARLLSACGAAWSDLDPPPPPPMGSKKTPAGRVARPE